MTRSKKGVGGRKRSRNTAHRNAEIVQEVLDLEAQDPDRLVKDIEIGVAKHYGVCRSYIRRLLAEHRKEHAAGEEAMSLRTPRTLLVHTPTSWDEFHAIEAGQYFLNPSDGKLYKRKTDL